MRKISVYIESTFVCQCILVGVAVDCLIFKLLSWLANREEGSFHIVEGVVWSVCKKRELHEKLRQQKDL